MKRFLAILVCVLATGICSAAVSVNIVDYPARVLVYSPMLVTARVVNHGPDSVLVPTKGLIKIGSSPDNLSWYDPVDSSGGSVIWLEPKEAWLFQVDLGLFWTHAPGPLYVVAGIQSNGECLYRATGSETFPLKLVHETPTRRWYECWSGAEFSDDVAISIELPQTPVDSEALEFFERNSFLGGIPTAGVWSGSGRLLEQFPSSEVTYAVALQHCGKSPDCLQELLDRQPQHPLSVYARFRLAMARLDTGQTAESVKDLELPEGLELYLVQEIRKARKVPPKSK